MPSVAEAQAAAQALLAAAVGRFDRNHDGKIDHDDHLPRFIASGLMMYDKNHDQAVDASDFLPMIDALDKNGDGEIDINDLPEDVRAPLHKLDKSGDGIINRADVPGILAALGDKNHDGKIDLSDLPASTRSGLFHMLGRDGDAASRAHLRPIMDALGSSATGRLILDNLDHDGDGNVSARELALAWAKLPAPGSLRLAPDGKSVDLDALPAAVREAVLASLDADEDGLVSADDLRPF